VPALLDVTISVVIPALNEAANLPHVLPRIPDEVHEVILVDGHSTDGTVEVARALLPSIRIVEQQGTGKGNALRAGFAAARGRYILMGDADVSYDFAELPRFHAEIEKGYELVMGSRLRGSIAPGAMPWLHRYLGNPVLSGLLRLLFGVPVSDAHCGLRAFTKDAVERMDLRTGGMELASEIVIKAGAAGLRITEIPITLHKDARGRPPHLRSFRDGWRHLRYMLMMAPNWLFFLPGLVALGAGTLDILLLLPGPLPVGRATLDVHTMLVGMALVLLGVYLLLLGCFVKAFSYTERLGAGRKGRFAAALRQVKLEHGLLAGGALVLVGLLGDLWFLAEWLAAGAPRLDAGATLRPAILYTTLLVAGLQVVFGAFFLSMLGISRDDYVGDYTEGARS
jgi:glycosyltransferase involved in cell wall biosynthesis